MSSHKFVCFGCRYSAKRNIHQATTVRCGTCGAECVYLGYRIPIPPRRNGKAWEALRQQVWRERRQRAEKAVAFRVRRRHGLEQAIARIEQRPSNAGRRALLKQLKRRLAAVQGHGA